jgi:hypothetical protein
MGGGIELSEKTIEQLPCQPEMGASPGAGLAAAIGAD